MRPASGAGYRAVRLRTREVPGDTEWVLQRLPDEPCPEFREEPKIKLRGQEIAGGADAWQTEEAEVRRGPRGTQGGQTTGEEIANAVTHGIGALLSLAGLALLLVFAIGDGGAARVSAAAVFGATLVLVFLSSAFYHALRQGRAKRLFLLLDHCAIFLLIAGTYTPVALLALPADPGRPILLAIWILAVLGIVFKIVSFLAGALERWDGFSVLFYLAMGWFGLLWAGGAPLGLLHPSAMAWLLAGGIVYSAGVVFYFWQRLPFGHAVWHLFVLAGSACHFTAVFYYVLPAAA